MQIQTDIAPFEFADVAYAPNPDAYANRIIEPKGLPLHPFGYTYALTDAQEHALAALLWPTAQVVEFDPLSAGHAPVYVDGAYAGDAVELVGVYLEVSNHG